MTDVTKPDAKAMTKEQAAEIVKRQVPKFDKDSQPMKDKDGQPVLESRSIPLDEIIGWKEYADHVIVVTSAGEKLRGEKKSK